MFKFASNKYLKIMELIELINVSKLSEYLGLSKFNLRKKKPFKKAHVKQLRKLFKEEIPRMWDEEERKLTMKD